MDRSIVKDLQKLSPEDRARRCRLLAGEAMAKAIASPRLAKLYVELAQDWVNLASEFERPADVAKEHSARGL